MLTGIPLIYNEIYTTNIRTRCSTAGRRRSLWRRCRLCTAQEQGPWRKGADLQLIEPMGGHSKTSFSCRHAAHANSAANAEPKQIRVKVTEGQAARTKIVERCHFGPHSEPHIGKLKVTAASLNTETCKPSSF